MREMLSVFLGICGASGRFAGLCGLVRAAGRRVARSFLVVVVFLAVAASAGVAMAEGEKAGYPDKWLFNLPEAAFAHRAAGDEMVGWRWRVEGVYHRSGEAPEVVALLRLTEYFDGRFTFYSEPRDYALFSLFSGEWRQLDSEREVAEVLSDYMLLTTTNEDVVTAQGTVMSSREGCQPYSACSQSMDHNEVFYSDMCDSFCADRGEGNRCEPSPAGVFPTHKGAILFEEWQRKGWYGQEDMKFLIHANAEAIATGKTRCTQYTIGTCTNPTRPYTCLDIVGGELEYVETGFIFSLTRIVALPDDTLLAYDINEFRGVFVRLQKDASVHASLRDRFKWMAYAVINERWGNPYLSMSDTTSSKELADFVAEESCTEYSENLDCIRGGK